MNASTGVLGAARVYGTPLSQEGIEDRAYRLHFNQVPSPRCAFQWPFKALEVILFLLLHDLVPFYEQAG